MTIRETESFQHQHVAEKLRERIRTVGSHNNCDATPTNENIEAQKVAYDDKINRLHESNKELKRLHVELQREITTISQRNEQQNNKLQSELVKVKADFDAKKIDTARLESRLDCFEDELKEFEVQKLKIACRDGSSHTKRIKDLDESLHGATIRYNEALLAHTAHKQVLNRLKEERGGSNQDLDALEREKRGCVAIHNDVIRLSCEACAARDAAQRELHRVRSDYGATKIQREEQMRRKRNLLRLRKQIKKKRDELEAKRLDAEGERSDHSSQEVSGTDGLPFSLNDGDEFYTAEEKQQWIDVYEDAARKVKAATGANDAKEAVQKIFGEEGALENVTALTQQNHMRIIELKVKKEELDLQKESSIYGAHENQGDSDAMCNWTDKLSDSHRLEISRNNKIQIEATILAVKSAVKYVQDKIDLMREDFGYAKLDLSDETLLDVFTNSGNILKAALAKFAKTKHFCVNNSANLDEQAASDVSSKADDNLLSIVSAIGEERIPALSPYNQRVTLPTVAYDEEDDHPASFENSTAGVAVEDEEAVAREQMKYASRHLVRSEEKLRRSRQRQSALQREIAGASPFFPV